MLESQIVRSNLPIVVVEAKGNSINDYEKITIDLKIIDPPSYYQTNQDQANVYAGKAGIELRGSSSQSFPKKRTHLKPGSKMGRIKMFPYSGGLKMLTTSFTHRIMKRV